MLFRDLIGLDELSGRLIRMVDDNRLSHALLLLGKEGSGALPLGLALAHYVVSRPLAPEPMPDIFGGFTAPPPAYTADTIDQSPAYQRAAALQHPDVHYTYPTYRPDKMKAGKTPVSADFIEGWRSFIAGQPYGNAYDWLQHIKAENKQGNITAAECNEIAHKMALRPFESEYKVLLLWMPEYLDKEGNRLLKLIEEPPDNTLFILVAQNENAILPTILSRCQTIRVPYPADKAVEAALAQRYGAPPERAVMAAAIAAGNMREALQQLERSEDRLMPVMRSWMNALLRNTDGTMLMKWIDEQSKAGRENHKQLFLCFIDLIQQSVRLQLMGSGAVRLPEEEIEFCRRLGKMLPAPQAEALVKELGEAIYFVERNANAKMLYHALSTKIRYLLKDGVLLQVY